MSAQETGILGADSIQILTILQNKKKLIQKNNKVLFCTPHNRRCFELAYFFYFHSVNYCFLHFNV